MVLFAGGVVFPFRTDGFLFAATFFRGAAFLADPFPEDATARFLPGGFVFLEDGGFAAIGTFFKAPIKMIIETMITISANAFVGCGVYPRPEREGLKPSPTIAETMIMAIIEKAQRTDLLRLLSLFYILDIRTGDRPVLIPGQTLKKLIAFENFIRPVHLGIQQHGV